MRTSARGAARAVVLAAGTQSYGTMVDAEGPLSGLLWARPRFRRSRGKDVRWTWLCPTLAALGFGA
jgi:hypothetical protein